MNNLFTYEVLLVGDSYKLSYRVIYNELRVSSQENIAGSSKRCYVTQMRRPEGTSTGLKSCSQPAHPQSRFLGSHWAYLHHGTDLSTVLVCSDSRRKAKEERRYLYNSSILSLAIPTLSHCKCPSPRQFEGSEPWVQSFHIESSKGTI